MECISLTAVVHALRLRPLLRLLRLVDQPEDLILLDLLGLLLLASGRLAQRLFNRIKMQFSLVVLCFSFSNPCHLLFLYCVVPGLPGPAHLPVGGRFPRCRGATRPRRRARREARPARRHRLKRMHVEHVAPFEHILLVVSLHYVLQLLAVLHVLGGHGDAGVLVDSELLELLLDGLEGGHLRGRDLGVRALGGDGLLVAVNLYWTRIIVWTRIIAVALGNEVALGALDEVLLELGGQGVPVRVGVLLQGVLAELWMLAVELQSGVLVDRQRLRWPGLVDDALLVASQRLSQALARRGHDVFDICFLDLDVAPARDEVKPLIWILGNESG